MNKAKILTVDDDPRLTALVKVYLERTGLYEVQEVNCPQEALAAARAFRPDAILLDVFMPGKDGRTIAKEMSQEMMLQRIPIMFFTSEAADAAPAHADAAQAGTPCLAKTNDPKVLVGAVARLLASGCTAPAA
jgi:CheY-like chemotaxis protein